VVLATIVAVFLAIDLKIFLTLTGSRLMPDIRLISLSAIRSLT